MMKINTLLKKIKTILTNEMIYLISDVFIKGIAFITLPLFTQKMSTAEYGEFSLYQSYVSLLGVFFSLDITIGIVKYYVDHENEKKKLGTALIIISVVSALCTSVLLLLNEIFNIFALGAHTLFLICLTTMFYEFFQLLLEDYRGQMRALSYGLCSIALCIFSTGLGLIYIYVYEDNYGYYRFLSVSVITILLGLIAFMIIAFRDGVHFDKQTAIELLKYSIPLIPYTLSATIIAQINKIFMSGISLEKTGVYSFASNLANIMYVATLSLNRAFQPILFRSLRDNRDYKARLTKNLFFYTTIYVVFLLCIDILVNIFGNSEYARAKDIIPILTLGYGYFFLYSLIVNFYYYYSKNKLISMFSLVSAGIIFIVSWIMIPVFGYYGAAFASLISYVFLFYIAKIYLQYKMKIMIMSEKYWFLIQILYIAAAMIRFVL